jgi:hypothetical protein
LTMLLGELGFFDLFELKTSHRRRACDSDGR